MAQYSRRSIPVRSDRGRRRWPSKRPLIIIILLIASVIGVSFWLFNHQKNSTNPDNAAQIQEPTFDKTQFSLTDPASSWVVVNKKRPLNPATYVPAGLVVPNITLKGGKESESMKLAPPAASALETLNADAKAAGIKLSLVSGYRSYNSQKTIYDSEVKGFGQAQADRESARPGHSEHQTGLAVDLGGATNECEIKICFAETAEGQWLADNAYKYGFVLRYAKDQESVTGYQFEPWHLRYVGTVLSQEMQRTGMAALEAFFGLPSAPSY